MGTLPMVQQIRAELAANLEVRASITMRTGDFVNVGEEFRVTFQVSNHLTYLDAAFKDVWLFVEATPFATPRDGAQVNVRLGDIPSRGSRSADVRFKALARFQPMVSLDLPEPYTKARVRAQFDIQSLFHNLWQERTFVTQIEAT